MNFRLYTDRVKQRPLVLHVVLERMAGLAVDVSKRVVLASVVAALTYQASGQCVVT